MGFNEAIVVTFDAVMKYKLNMAREEKIICLERFVSFQGFFGKFTWSVDQILNKIEVSNIWEQKNISFHFDSAMP